MAKPKKFSGVWHVVARYKMLIDAEWEGVFPEPIKVWSVVRSPNRGHSVWGV